MANILLVEDMDGIRESLEVILDLAGHTVTTSKDGKAGIKLLEDGSYDLVITDILMPEVDGIEVIIKAKEKHPNNKVLAISAGGKGISSDEALEIASKKADATLKKPFSKEDLLTKVNELLS